MLTRVAATVLFAVATTSCTPTAVPEPALAPASENETPSGLGRSAFVQELISARPTERTPLFDDYTEGSYHVEKMDLLDGVRQIRAKERVIGFAVLGPAGPLWTYYVIIVLEDEGGYRINALTMAHARITSKGTGPISRADYERAWGKLARQSGMADGPPSFESLGGQRDPGLPLEWHYKVLVADWSGGSERLCHSRHVQEPELQDIAGVLNELLNATEVTYPRTGRR